MCAAIWVMTFLALFRKEGSINDSQLRSNMRACQEAGLCDAAVRLRGEEASVAQQKHSPDPRARAVWQAAQMFKRRVYGSKTDEIGTP